MNPSRQTPRRLLVFTPSTLDTGYSEQRRLLQDHERGFAERDLLTTVFLENDEAVETRDRYGIVGGSFMVVLVGRDGGEKFRSDEPVPAEALFARIDAMPMRRREMRES